MFKRGASAFLCAAALLACALIFIACNKTSQKPARFETCFEIAANYDDENKIFSVKQDTLYFADGDSDEIKFRLYANAFGDDNDIIDISSVEIDGSTVEYDICGDDRTVLKLKHEAIKDAAYYIRFNYAVKIPHKEARLGEYGGRVNLAHFYPCPAKFENGWREDPVTKLGDPFFNDIASFYATIEFDGELDIAASGRVDVSAENGVKIAEIAAENIRDFALYLGKFDKIESKASLDGHVVDVDYFYFDDVDPQETVQRAVESLELFAAAFGDYPYNTYTAVQANIGGAGGMEYGTLAVVAPSPDRSAFLDAVCHETAHQWWFGLVGNDQLNAAWLDEGLAEFCTYYFYYLKGDRNKFNSAMKQIALSFNSFAALENAGFDRTMQRPLSSFLTEGEYVAVAYMEGAMMFDYLHSLIGDVKFKAALQCFRNDNLFGVADCNSLISAFKKQGYDLKNIISAWIK